VALEYLINGAAQCFEAARRKVDLRAQLGIGIVSAHAMEEVDARTTVGERGDRVPVGEGRYHLTAPRAENPEVQIWSGPLRVIAPIA
jgi:hypothetical protein